MKIISLNIEGNKHYDRIIPFLEQEDPDVICLQEVLLEDFPMLEKSLAHMQGIFKPFTYCTSLHEAYRDVRGKLFGNAIFAKNSHSFGFHYYHGSERESYTPFEECCEDEIKRRNYVVVFTQINDPGTGGVFTVATTHFPVTKEGESTPHQREIVEPLVKYLRPLGEVLLCGDFNAPRGKETFDLLAQEYHDMVPQEYFTSLDQKLHRVPGLMFMVDGLFATQKDRVISVKLQDGLSDHMAMVAVTR